LRRTHTIPEAFRDQVDRRSRRENEPIVDTPAQALDCFMRTNMDLLVLHRTLVQRRR